MEQSIQMIKHAVEFTEIYKRNSGDKYLREARCVAYQLEHILQPLEPGDRLAGMMRHELVGFSSQYGGIYTYYFHEPEFLAAFQDCKEELDETTRKKAEVALEFWKLENTRKKVTDRFIHRYGFEMGYSFHSAGFANCDCRVAGTNVDFQKLIRLGLDGLDEEIDRCAAEKENGGFYQALHLWVDAVRNACARYAWPGVSCTGISHGVHPKVQRLIKTAVFLFRGAAVYFLVQAVQAQADQLLKIHIGSGYPAIAVCEPGAVKTVAHFKAVSVDKTIRHLFSSVFQLPEFQRDFRFFAGRLVQLFLAVLKGRQKLRLVEIVCIDPAVLRGKSHQLMAHHPRQPVPRLQRLQDVLQLVSDTSGFPQVLIAAVALINLCEFHRVFDHLYALLHDDTLFSFSSFKVPQFPGKNNREKL